MGRFRFVEDGVYVGPQPTAQDLDEARRQGIRTVVDLRIPSETRTSNRELTRNHGLEWVNVPVDKENLAASQIDELEATMSSHDGPFLVHCATGARAALLLSLSKARAHGWSPEQTFDHARSMGYDLTASPAFSNFVTQQTA